MKKQKKEEPRLDGKGLLGFCIHIYFFFNKDITVLLATEAVVEEVRYFFLFLFCFTPLLFLFLSIYSFFHVATQDFFLQEISAI